MTVNFHIFHPAGYVSAPSFYRIVRVRYIHDLDTSISRNVREITSDSDPMCSGKSDGTQEFKYGTHDLSILMSFDAENTSPMMMNIMSIPGWCLTSRSEILENSGKGLIGDW